MVEISTYENLARQYRDVIEKKRLELELAVNTLEYVHKRINNAKKEMINQTKLSG